MNPASLEFLITRAEQNPAPNTVARLAQHAITAFLHGQLDHGTFTAIVAPHVDQKLLLDDQTSQVDRPVFTIRSLTAVVGSDAYPNQVTLSGDVPFNFRLGDNGQPTYQIYEPDACI